MKFSLEVETTGEPMRWAYFRFRDLRHFWCIGILRAPRAWAFAHFFGIVWLGRPNPRNSPRLYGVSRTKFDGINPSPADPCGELRGVRWEFGNKTVERFQPPPRKLVLFFGPGFADPTYSCPIVELLPGHRQVFFTGWRARLATRVVRTLCPKDDKRAIPTNGQWQGGQ